MYKKLQLFKVYLNAIFEKNIERKYGYIFALMLTHYKTNDNKNFSCTSFYQRICQAISKGFETIEEGDIPDLLSYKDFLSLLDNIAVVFFEADFGAFCASLFHLANQFTIPNYNHLPRIEMFVQMNVCLLLHSMIDDVHLIHLAPYVLQLFVNITAHETENKYPFSQFSIEHRAIETIMHLKRLLPEPHRPLLFLFTYNIYCHSYNYVLYETTEVQDLFTRITNEREASGFLVPCSVMNLFRKESFVIDNHLLKMFEYLIDLSEQDNYSNSLYSLWSLYFVFKNNYLSLSRLVKKPLLKLLNRKLLCNDETSIRIALFIYSHCFFLQDDLALFNSTSYIPFMRLIELLHSGNFEIMAQTMTCLNNFFFCGNYNYSYLREFLKKDQFEFLCGAAQMGNISCKLESGFLMTNILLNASYSKVLKILNGNVMNTLIDLIQVNDIELSIAVVQFIITYLPRIDWLVSFLIESNHDAYFESLIGSTGSIIMEERIEKLIRVILYKRKELEEKYE